MSYILDALKKADQQRQHAAPPTLRSAPETVVETKKSRTWRYVAMAIVVLGAGVLIGRFQQLSAPPQTKANVAPPPAAPREPMASAMPQSPAPVLPAPQQVPVPTLPAPIAVEEKPPVRDITPTTANAPAYSPVAEPARQQVLTLEELPLAVRQELPPMTVSLHAWSATPQSRLVSINNQLLHEGDSPAAGVTVEQITPDGMIMSFRGYRFQRGVK